MRLCLLVLIGLFTIKKDMDLIGVFEKDEAPIEQFYINVNADPANAGYVVGAGTFPKVQGIL